MRKWVDYKKAAPDFMEKIVPVQNHGPWFCMFRRMGLAGNSPKRCIVSSQMYQPSFAVHITLGCTTNMAALVISVHSKATHAFSKDTLDCIFIVAGQGVEVDAHYGLTVQHRSRVAKDPTQPNLRQVHLIHHELLDELDLRGLPVRSGQMGENITTTGLPLLNLSVGTLLRIGTDAVLKITGLRNPCSQIEGFMPGLLAAVLDRSADGALIRKAGLMAIALESGVVLPGDEIEIISTPEIHVPLQPV
jgi:hypothetical protein